MQIRSNLCLGKIISTKPSHSVHEPRACLVMNGILQDLDIFAIPEMFLAIRQFTLVWLVFSQEEVLEMPKINQDLSLFLEVGN